MSEVLSTEQVIMEFYLDYESNRRKPGEVFHAMGYLIEAYERFGMILSEAAGTEHEFELIIDEVAGGSILGKLIKVFDKLTDPDPLIESLTQDMGTYSNLVDFSQKQEERLKRTYAESGHDGTSENFEPTLDLIELTEAMEIWTKGLKSLKPDEKLTISSSRGDTSQQVKLNRGFRFTGDKSKIFSNRLGQHDGPEIIDVVKPCFKGDKNWLVQNRETKTNYVAPILNKKWLQDYQDDIHRVGPKDSLEVHSCYEVWNVKGERRIRNAKIKDVKRIIHCTGQQDDFF